MAQQVIRCGNSLVVTIPNKFVKVIGVKAGDVVQVEKRLDRSEITICFHGVQQLAISKTIFRRVHDK